MLPHWRAWFRSRRKQDHTAFGSIGRLFDSISLQGTCGVDYHKLYCLTPDDGVRRRFRRPQNPRVRWALADEASQSAAPRRPLNSSTKRSGRPGFFARLARSRDAHAGGLQLAGEQLVDRVDLGSHVAIFVETLHYRGATHLSQDQTQPGLPVQ